MLIDQDPTSYQCFGPAGTVEAAGSFSDLEKLENDVENMLKVVEKHLDSRNDEEKVGCFQTLLSFFFSFSLWICLLDLLHVTEEIQMWFMRVIVKASRDLYNAWSSCTTLLGGTLV